MTDELKRILTRPRQISQRIQRLKDSIEGARDTAAISAVYYSGVRSSGPHTSRQERYIIKIEDIVNEIRRLQCEYLDALNRVDELLEQLPVEERCFIRSTYVKGEGARQVQKALGLPPAMIGRVRKSGLEHLEAILEAEHHDTTDAAT